MLKWQSECEQQIALRDQFAAAALTGLIVSMTDEYELDEVCQSAYGWADAMLKASGTAVRGNCVSGNQPEIPSPVTEPMPKEKRAEVSGGGPVAWAVWVDPLEPTLCINPVDARDLADDSNVSLSPLYLKPQPTLTDAEREAVENAAWMFGAAKAHPEWQALAATLRGLLERL